MTVFGNRVFKRNGWEIPATGGYAKPTLVVQDSLCILSGLVKPLNNRSPSNKVFEVPKECWPTQKLTFRVNDHQKTLRVDVMPTGDVRLVPNEDDEGEPIEWLSLDGIVLAKKGKFTRKPLKALRGWQQVQKLSYSTAGNVCELEGTVEAKLDSLPGSPIVQLPKHCRPMHTLVFNARSDHDNARLEINSKGQIFPKGEASEEIESYSLSGIAFVPQASFNIKSSQLHLKLRWKATASGYTQPQVFKSGRLCFVEGVVEGGSPGDVIALLPTWCRPETVHVFNVNNRDSSCRLDVHPDGSLRLMQGGLGGFVSLSGTVFAAW